MSKVVVYVLDKVVWMLLIAAVTTQALQIAGVFNTPKAFGDITYKQDAEYSFQIKVDDGYFRGKRQTDQRSQFIDNLFNIPISALRAVNNFVQNTRPAIQNIREFASKRFERMNERTDTKKNEQNQTKPQRLYPVYVQSNDKN